MPNLSTPEFAAATPQQIASTRPNRSTRSAPRKETAPRPSARERSAAQAALAMPAAPTRALPEVAPAPKESARAKPALSPRPSGRSARSVQPVARRARTDLVGIPLASLATCHSDQEEDRLKLAVIAASAGRTSCENDAGVFHLVEAKNLNAFLLSIEGARSRKLADRCTELVHAIECLQGER